MEIIEWLTYRIRGDAMMINNENSIFKEAFFMGIVRNFTTCFEKFSVD